MISNFDMNLLEKLDEMIAARQVGVTDLPRFVDMADGDDTKALIRFSADKIMASMTEMEWARGG